MMSDITIDRLVEIDRKMAGALDELQAKMDTIEKQREEVRTAILDLMQEQNLESVRTTSGTVTRQIKERFWTNDWAMFNQYVLEHGAVDLLEKRIQQTNMRAWIDAHPDDYPPGLNVDRKYSITIRKPRGGGNKDE